MQLDYLFNTNEDSGMETETNKRHVKVAKWQMQSSHGEIYSKCEQVKKKKPV